MKKLLFIPLLFICLIANATQVVIPTVYQPSGQVTNVNLNNNWNAIATVVNGNLDNSNADTTNGYRFFETKAALPAAGSQGRVVFLTTNNTLNADNGTSWQSFTAITGTPSVGQAAIYDGSAWVATTIPTQTPSGVIVMWSGSIASIPSGWELSDGTCAISCPDLRDKFIVGSGSTYAVDATGGATTHAHNISRDGWGEDNTTPSASGRLLTTDPEGANRLAANDITSGSGSSLPPYYSLAYIIKD